MSMKYPQELTAARWSKEKGVIAKLLKRDTGVGAALTALEAAYDSVDWNAMTRTPDKISDIDQIVRKATNDLTTLIDAVPEAQTKAKAAAEACRSNAAIPASTADYLDVVVEATKKFERNVRETLRAVCDRGAGEATRLQRDHALIVSQLKTLVADVDNIVKPALAELDHKVRDARTVVQQAEDALGDIAVHLVAQDMSEAGKARGLVDQASVAARDIAGQARALVAKALPEARQRRAAILVSAKKHLDGDDLKKCTGALDANEESALKCEQRVEQLGELAERAGQAAHQADQLLKGGLDQVTLATSLCNRAAEDAMRLDMDLNSQLASATATVSNAQTSLLNAQEAKDPGAAKSHLAEATQLVIRGAKHVKEFESELLRARAAVENSLKRLPSEKHTGGPEFNGSMARIKESLKAFDEYEKEADKAARGAAKCILEIKQMAAKQE